MQTKEIGPRVFVDLATATKIADTKIGDLMTAKQVIDGVRYDDCDVVFLDAPEGYLVEPERDADHDPHGVWLADMGMTPEDYAKATKGLSLF